MNLIKNFEIMENEILSILRVEFGVVSLCCEIEQKFPNSVNRGMWNELHIRSKKPISEVAKILQDYRKVVENKEYF